MSYSNPSINVSYLQETAKTLDPCVPALKLQLQNMFVFMQNQRQVCEEQMGYFQYCWNLIACKLCITNQYTVEKNAEDKALKAINAVSIEEESPYPMEGIVKALIELLSKVVFAVFIKRRPDLFRFAQFHPEISPLLLLLPIV